MTADGPLPESTADADQRLPPGIAARLDDFLYRHDPTLGRIVRLESHPYDDRTSFHLLDLEIELEDGSGPAASA